MLSTLPYGNAVPFSYEAQVRPRQGLSPCWFNTLAIALATRFHLVEGMCKLKTRTHMGKTRTHKGKLAARLSDGTKADTVPES